MGGGMEWCSKEEERRKMIQDESDKRVKKLVIITDILMENKELRSKMWEKAELILKVLEK